MKNVISSRIQNRTLIAALALVFTLVWALVGHIVPPMHYIFTCCFFLLIYLVLEESTSTILSIPLICALIIIDDITFRLAGGGVQDDIARGLCMISFYFTFSAIVIASFVLIFINEAKRKTKGKIKIKNLTGKLLYASTILLFLYVFYQKAVILI